MASNQDEIPGISIQRLAQVAAEKAARQAGVSGEATKALQDSIFNSLRDVVGWKLFDREAT